MTSAGPSEAHELIRCPECGSGEHVDIRSVAVRTWVASCNSCATEWALADPRL